MPTENVPFTFPSKLLIAIYFLIKNAIFISITYALNQNLLQVISLTYIIIKSSPKKHVRCKKTQ